MSLRIDQVCGNAHVKRALEVALAGNHSILFLGAHDSDAEEFSRIAREKGLRALAYAPCPCGYYGDPMVECTCTAELLHENQVLVRQTCIGVDVVVEVVRPGADAMIRWVQNGFRDEEPDEDILARVAAARNRRSRSMSVDDSAWSLLRAAIVQQALSPQEARRCYDVAITVAALAGSDRVEAAHAAEAVQYRPSKPMGGE